LQNFDYYKHNTGSAPPETVGMTAPNRSDSFECPRTDKRSTKHAQHNRDMRQLYGLNDQGQQILVNYEIHNASLLKVITRLPCLARDTRTSNLEMIIAGGKAKF
jgi:hypothetical protein